MDDNNQPQGVTPLGPAFGPLDFFVMSICAVIVGGMVYDFFKQTVKFSE